MEWNKKKEKCFPFFFAVTQPQHWCIPLAGIIPGDTSNGGQSFLEHELFLDGWSGVFIRGKNATGGIYTGRRETEHQSSIAKRSIDLFDPWDAPSLIRYMMILPRASFPLVYQQERLLYSPYVYRSNDADKATVSYPCRLYQPGSLYVEMYSVYLRIKIKRFVLFSDLQ